MIPVNNAIVTCLTAMTLAALITAWAYRGYWHARVRDAYQDGHTAGIATQIGRQRRALGRHHADSGRVLAAYRERAIPAAPAEPETDVIVANLTGARARPARQLPPGVIPFPEGLPDGLREFAQHSLAAAARQPR